MPNNGYYEVADTTPGAGPQGSTPMAGGMAQERMPAQVYIEPGKLGNEELPNAQRRFYRIYRAMRSDPTIAFARMLRVSPLVSIGWNYRATEYAPPNAAEFLTSVLEPIRVRLMKTALESYIDYGWAPYEIVKRVDEWGYTTLDKVKPLLQSYTEILVDKDTGAFIGLRQDTGDRIDLNSQDALLITFDVEGTDWYGWPLMENARKTWEAWNVVEKASERYDQKIAGSHWVIHYPPGTSAYNGKQNVDNFLIAKEILSSMTASGKVIVPSQFEKLNSDNVDQSQRDSWSVEILSDKGTAKSAFIDRQRYLDALKVRAFGIPERAILEGQFGTKAEAEAQADFAIVNIELSHVLVCQQVSKQLANLLLESNWGREYHDSVVIEPNPLTDQQTAFIRTLYTQLLQNPQVLMQELSAIDTTAMRDQLDIPEVPQQLQQTDNLWTNENSGLLPIEGQQQIA